MAKQECGRLQYFYHCPSSALPIRDVLNEQGYGFKTEPHIEIGAENFLKDCFQFSISSFVKKGERYLFLMTNCRHPGFDVFGVKSVVGYIDVHESGMRDDSVFVLGDAFLVPFHFALPIAELGYHESTRIRLVDEQETGIILERFSGLDNIVEECVEEIQILDSDGLSCKKDCNYKEECIRF